MQNKKLENKIITLIPSNTVKAIVKQQKHQFSDTELLFLVLEFAIYWDDKIMLLEELKKNVNDVKLKKYIISLIKFEKKQFDLLTRLDKDYVYQVDMKPESHSEKYLVPNYMASFITIDSYFRNYKDILTEDDCFEIIIRKLRISERKRASDIDNKDELVTASYNRNKKLKDISSVILGPDPIAYGIECESIKYPAIFKKGDLVYYNLNYYTHDIYYNFKEDNTEYSNGDKRVYAINSFDNDKAYAGSVDEACILLLNEENVKYKTITLDENGYCSYLINHIHLDYGYLEKVVIEELPDHIKEDYSYAIKRLTDLKIL